jgi:hypothetical protein
MSLIFGEPAPSRHPSLDRPRYVPRLGVRDRRLLRNAQGGLVGAPCVAMPLWIAMKHKAFAAEVREDYRLALAVDPEAHLAQEAEALRPVDYDCAALGLPTRFDLMSEELTLEAARSAAETTIDLENEAGATLFITHAPLAGGMACVGRKNSVRLAEQAIDYFEEEGLDAPLLHEPGDLEREIFVGISLKLETLRDPRERSLLVAAYAALGGHGFWVRVLGLSDRAKAHDAAAGAAFLFELQRVSERPVVLVGASNISVAFLAGKLAGVSFGIGENEYFSSPPVKGSGKRSLVVFSHPLLRNIAVPARGKRGKGADAFRALPCFCGEHPAKAPPTGSEKKPHTLACRVRQAAEITQGDFAESVELLEKWVAEAEARGHSLDYPLGLFEAWRAVTGEAVVSRARAA